MKSRNSCEAAAKLSLSLQEEEDESPDKKQKPNFQLKQLNPQESWSAFKTQLAKSKTYHIPNELMRIILRYIGDGSLEIISKEPIRKQIQKKGKILLHQGDE